MALAKSMFRSGRLPDLIRSDRGPDFKNAMMAEFAALVGLSNQVRRALAPSRTSMC